MVERIEPKMLKAKAAIDAVFGESKLTERQTVERLKELRDYTDELIAALTVDA
jgi:hypothetical protein